MHRDYDRCNFEYKLVSKLDNQSISCVCTTMLQDTSLQNAPLWKKRLGP